MKRSIWSLSFPISIKLNVKINRIFTYSNLHASILMSLEPSYLIHSKVRKNYTFQWVSSIIYDIWFSIMWNWSRMSKSMFCIVVEEIKTCSSSSYIKMSVPNNRVLLGYWIDIVHCPGGNGNTNGCGNEFLALKRLSSISSIDNSFLLLNVDWQNKEKLPQCWDQLRYIWKLHNHCMLLA